MPILNWLNRDEALTATSRAPYRLLQAVPEHSYGDFTSDNMLIQGDNLDGLKALLPYYAGKVKCIYIDPPYNTRSAFAHYDDNLEHATWLTMMYPRLELLRDLLAEDGSIWVSIDDNEGHYLKVVMDEIFGRDNFIADITWRKRDGAPNDRKIGAVHEHIFVYAKSGSEKSQKTKAELAFNLMPRTEKANSKYKVFKEPNGPDSRGPFRKVDTTANAKGGRFVASLVYAVRNPFTGENVYPREGRCWAYNSETMSRLQAENRIYWGVKGTAGTPMRKLFLSEAKQGMTTPTIWDDVALNQHASSEMECIFGRKAAFETPKPERLLQRILQIATNEEEIVLDPTLGSGTTAAVAHKMNRKYVAIEMGEQAITHGVVRLKKVVDGDRCGISKAVNWLGGGGFRFYRLGPAVFDSSGRLNPDIRFPTLAAHIWFIATKTPYTGDGNSALLGIHDGTAYYLLYNGILGDKSVNGGNVLTSPVLRSLPAVDGPKVIFGETSRLGAARLKNEQIVFRQIPYEIEVQ